MRVYLSIEVAWTGLRVLPSFRRNGRVLGINEDHWIFEQLPSYITLVYRCKHRCTHNARLVNLRADGDEDLRIATQRLVRFRLCPSDTCSMENAAGCKVNASMLLEEMDSPLRSSDTR